MKQVVQRLGRKGIELLDVPAPSVQEGHVLVKTLFSLISSGTERASREFAEASLLKKAQSKPELARRVVQQLWSEGIGQTIERVRSRLNKPEALGYSLSGRVVAVSKSCQDFRPGDAVACTGAGYAVHAEVVSVPTNLVTKVPPTLDLQYAAFVSVGAIALHAVRQADLRLGESVVVIGLGLVGQLCVGLCSASGCEVAGIDLATDKLEVAKRMGASVVLDRENAVGGVERLTCGRGADAVLVCAATESNDPLILAGQLARSKGKVIIVGDVGMAAPRDIYYAKELEVRNSRSMGPGRYDPQYEEKGVDYPYEYVRWTENRNMEAFIDLLATNKLDLEPIISHRFPVAEVNEAYALLTDKSDQLSLGILIQYEEDPCEEVVATIPINKIPSKRFQASKSPSQRIGIGFLGSGSFSRGVLLPLLLKDDRVKPVTIVSSNGLAARELGEKFCFSFASTEESEIWSNPDIQVVVIANRHHLHARQVLQAFRAGKHVFVEKPLCLTVEELQEITELYRSLISDSKSPKLLVGFNRRFASLTRELQAFFVTETEPCYIQYRVNAGFIARDHWVQDPQIGGGRIIGEACHFIDLIYLLLGRPGLLNFDVCALPNLNRYSDDNVVIEMRFRNGSIGSLTYMANGDPAAGKERIEMHCCGKTAILEDFKKLDLYEKGKHKCLKYEGTDPKGHAAEISAFLDAIYLDEDGPIEFEELHFSTLLACRIADIVGAPDKDIL